MDACGSANFMSISPLAHMSSGAVVTISQDHSGAKIAIKMSLNSCTNIKHQYLKRYNIKAEEARRPPMRAIEIENAA